MQETAIAEQAVVGGGFWPPPRFNRRDYAVIGVLCGLATAAIVVAALSANDATRSSYPSCAAAGISTAQAKDGLCARGTPSNPIVYNVVDRDQVLTMPEYDAHLLAVRISPTSVRPAPGTASIYPDDRGQLVSAEVEIKNTSGSSLHFGPTVTEGAAPSYAKREPPIDLLLPSAFASEREDEFPAILNGIGAPRPSVFTKSIAPGATRIGWVSFVAAPDARKMMYASRSDLDFYRSDGAEDYVGQIRLWKYAARPFPTSSA